jgi:hypothetical protein
MHVVRRVTCIANRLEVKQFPAVLGRIYRCHWARGERASYRTRLGGLSTTVRRVLKALSSNCAEESCTRGDTIGHELTSSLQTAEMKQILEVGPSHCVPWVDSIHCVSK